VTQATDEGGPFDSMEALVDFLLATGYARRDRHGAFQLYGGGRDYLICRIALDVAALRREAVQATNGTEA
jgi:hypothetical protein